MRSDHVFKNVLAFLLAFVGLSVSAQDECSVRVGEYSGRVKAEWLTKTRQMRLLEDFAFKGPDCRIWPVPKGAVVDGASIPRVFWSVIGGPFDGPYRDGSVVHDYYCKVRTAPSDQVHEMFYHALLANGLDSVTAGLMYYAVSWFGPRWEILKRVSFSQDFSRFSVVRHLKDLRLSPTVVQQMATTVGQPSPFNVHLSSVMDFKPRQPPGREPLKWLTKDGAEVDHVSETEFQSAFDLVVQKSFSQDYGKSPGEVFRVHSVEAAAAPTKEQVGRLKRWIEQERPSLQTLKSTSPTQIPDLPR